MNAGTVESILGGLPERTIAVVGDFCLDRYLHIDPDIADASRETGRPIRQVVAVRAEPGGGSNVIANLAALRVGRLQPVGFIGRDGEGFELGAIFDRLGLRRDFLRESETRHTPVFMKPIIVRPGSGPPSGGAPGGGAPSGGAPEELDRLDIFPREPLSGADEARLIDDLRAAFDQADALVVADYGETGKSGVVTPAVRRAISELGQRDRGKPIVADSRLHAGAFRNVLVKPNALEAAAYLADPPDPEPTLPRLVELGQRAADRNKRAVFITLGADGVLVCGSGQSAKIPAYPSEREGPIDTVGAGDTTLAALAASLAAGAALHEAAILAMVAASITIQCLGTCGQPEPEQVRMRFGQYTALYPDVVGG